MKNILVLVHRIPFPPKKGDKVRTYNIIKNLAQYYHLYLGAFVDDEEDWQYTSDVESLCALTHFARLNPTSARLRSLAGLWTGEPLTLTYFRDQGMRRWVHQVMSEHAIQRVLVFCSSMAQYIDDQRARDTRSVIDFIDIDSDKWRQYAQGARWPMSWIYQRESRRLQSYECKIARRFAASVFVSPEEANLFRDIAGDVRKKIFFVNNGVDSDYFDPDLSYENPYSSEAKVLAFTGAMDYWANVDAATWFADKVFPGIQEVHPEARFYIVGAKPTNAVMGLSERPGIHVTGSVPDIRPFLAHAVAAVAPMQIARGVQNKVLEALAMGKSVLTTPAGIEGISGFSKKSVYVLEEPREFVDAASQILTRQNGNDRNPHARQSVLEHYNWDSNLTYMRSLLEGEFETHSGS